MKEKKWYYIITIFIILLLLAIFTSNIISIFPVSYQLNTVEQIQFQNNINIDYENYCFEINSKNETLNFSNYNIESPFSSAIYSVLMPQSNISNVALYKSETINETNTSGNLCSFSFKSINYDIRIENEISNAYKAEENDIYYFNKHKNKIAKKINNEYIIIAFDKNANETSYGLYKNYAIQFLNNISLSNENSSSIKQIKHINYYGKDINSNIVEEINYIGNQKCSFFYNDKIFTFTGNLKTNPDEIKKYMKQDNYWEYKDNTSTYKNYMILDKDKNIYHSFTINSSQNFTFDINTLYEIFISNQSNSVNDTPTIIKIDI